MTKNINTVIKLNEFFKVSEILSDNNRKSYYKYATKLLLKEKEEEGIGKYMSEKIKDLQLKHTLRNAIRKLIKRNINYYCMQMFGKKPSRITYKESVTTATLENVRYGIGRRENVVVYVNAPFYNNVECIIIPF